MPWHGGAVTDRRAAVSVTGRGARLPHPRVHPERKARILYKVQGGCPFGVPRQDLPRGEGLFDADL